MKEIKPFKTVDEQLKLLESRGVLVSDRARAKRFLLTENYYSVVNGYKDAFLDPDKTNQNHEVYREGTSFELFIYLYTFDKSLRRIALSALLDAEEAMRAVSIYAFCERNPGHEDYLDPICYSSSSDFNSKRYYSKNIIRLLSTLQSLSSNSQHKEHIAHYIKQHRCVPLWVLSRCITFGSMSSFFELQKLPIKQASCRYLEQSTGVAITPKQMQRAYKVLSQFRNICAHGERFYCARVGRNKENSFHELVELLALVLPSKRMSEFAKKVDECLALVCDTDIEDVDRMGQDLLSKMRVTREFIGSFIQQETPAVNANE